ncbi:MAG: alkaline phosphatase family protein [Planctomycetota bacterium]
MGQKRRVLLVGWDAADWKVIHPLMDAGHMPTVERLVSGGAMANLATLHPVLSPTLWTSIATGKRPFKHGIHGFSEPTPDGQGVQPISNLSRKSKALWNMLGQEGLRSVVVGWWPSHPAEPIHGTMVSNHFQKAVGPPENPWPAPPHGVHPPELTDTLAAMRINPNELPSDAVLSFIPQAAEIDQEKDRRVASCAKIMAEAASVHSVATHLLETEEWDFAAVYYDAIDHFCHGFMKYHPPQQDHISDRDFALYGGVVNAAYRFHDMMLARLLHIAGPDTTVLLISDHGFHPDHLRPQIIPAEPAGPAIEHRDFGVFVLNGPGVKEDALLHGLNLLDITPTVLSLFGLPVGDDMDGAPATDAWVEPPAIESISSWEARHEVKPGGDVGLHPPERRLDAAESQAALDQMVELGYIEPLGDNKEMAVKKTVRELRYNLARAYMDDSQHGEATEILTELYDAWPSEHRFGIQLAMCFRALDRIADLRTITEDLSTRRRAEADAAREQFKKAVEQVRAARQQKQDAGEEVPPLPPGVRMGLRQLRSRARFNPAAIDYLWGYALAAEGKRHEAVERLKKAESPGAARAGLSLQIGEAYLQLRRTRDAQRCFRAAEQIDPDNPHAKLGLARCALRTGKPERGVEYALDSLSRLYHNPLAHYTLARGLVSLGRADDAAEAARRAVGFNPNFPAAHGLLARLLRESSPSDSAEHLRTAEEIRAARRASRAERGRSPNAGWTPPVLAKRDAPPTAPRSASNRKPPTKPGELPMEPVTIVTGLPRSGTSMVMQMLDAAGVPAFTDGVRTSDEDNPRGYYEHEAIKRTASDARWVLDAGGKAAKVVAPLLPHLPGGPAYRVIHIDRDLDEVLASQTKMLERNAATGAAITPDRLRAVYTAQLQRAKDWIDKHAADTSLVLSFAEAHADPHATAQRLADFLGCSERASELAQAIDGTLHRNRKGNHE